MAGAGSIPVTLMPRPASGSNNGPLPHPTSRTDLAPSPVTMSTAPRSRSKMGPRPMSLDTGSLR